MIRNKGISTLANNQFNSYIYNSIYPLKEYFHTCINSDYLGGCFLSEKNAKLLTLYPDIIPHLFNSLIDLNGTDRSLLFKLKIDSNSFNTNVFYILQ